MKTTSPDIMKHNNKREILEIIYQNQHIYRAQIAELTNMSNQTITNLVKELVEEKKVIEQPIITNTKGRAPIALAINFDNQYTIGIELSVSNINFSLSTANGNVQKEITKKPNSNVIKMIKDCIRLFVNDVKDKQILGVAISVEGIMYEDAGYIISAKDLGLSNVDLYHELKEFNLPIIIRHDANILAELYSNKHKIDSLLMMKVDRGVGAGLVLNGDTLTSKDRVIGEMGHVVLYSNDNPQKCHCGKVGCLTTEASLYALEKKLNMNLSEIVTSYQNHDDLTIATINQISEYIAEALANIVSLFGLKYVVFSGKLFDSLGEVFFNQTKSSVIEHLDSWNTEVNIEMFEAINISRYCCELVTSNFYSRKGRLN